MKFVILNAENYSLASKNFSGAYYRSLKEVFRTLGKKKLEQ